MKVVTIALAFSLSVISVPIFAANSTRVFVKDVELKNGVNTSGSPSNLPACTLKSGQRFVETGRTLGPRIYVSGKYATIKNEQNECKNGSRVVLGEKTFNDATKSAL